MKKKVKSIVSCLLIVFMLLGIYQPYNIYATETDPNMQVEEIQKETDVSESILSTGENNEQAENVQTPTDDEKDADKDSVDAKDEEVSIIKILSFQVDGIFQNPVYVDAGVSLDEIVATFPENVIAFDDKENEIEIQNIVWVCESDIGEEWSELVYSFELPETYILGEDVQLPTISLCRAEDKISIASADGEDDSTDEDGTAEHPYLIYTIDDFEKVRQHLESGNYFKLMNDIDAENVAWRSISSSSSNPFKGNFDGNGYCIFNLEYMATNYGYGIFGYLKEASIHDLGIKVKNGVQISAGTDAGLLCRSGSASSILRCYVIGDLVTDYLDAECVGLIAGIFSGDISECYTQGYVYSYGNRALGRPTYCIAGGIVGAITGGNTSLTISNCISYSKVETAVCNEQSYAGGILGSGKNANITNCLFLGETLGGKKKILGQVYGNSKDTGTVVTNSYFSNNNSYNAQDELYGTGKTISELRQQNTYEGWDFVNIWTMDDGKNAGFPMLKCMEKIDREVSKYIKPTCAGYSIANNQTLLSNSLDFEVYFDRNIIVNQNEGVYFLDSSSGAKIQCQYQAVNSNKLQVKPSTSFVNGHNYKLLKLPTPIRCVEP